MSNKLETFKTFKTLKLFQTLKRAKPHGYSTRKPLLWLFSPEKNTEFKGSLLIMLGLAALLVCASSWAQPWFTGPLLAPAGLVMPNGHTNLETYGIYTDNEGAFNRRRHVAQNVNRGDGSSVMPIFSHGLAEDFDITYVTSYIFNHSQRFTSQEIGDVIGILGYQALKQKDSKWLPSLRMILLETLPTGRFNSLNEAFNGQDVTGVGGYRTGLGLNFEHLLPISEPIYLRTRFSVTYIFPHPISVRGINAYGGTPTTEGTIIPGQLVSLNLATELSLSQNLVAVMEGLYFNGGASQFRGYLGQSTTDVPATIGRPSAYEFSIAPAVEYNFTQRIGLIGGIWFPLLGRAAPNFTTYMVALNIYW